MKHRNPAKHTNFKALQKVLTSDLTLHHQIYVQLREEIIDGLWEKSKIFPGEEELAIQYGVSVITARKALMRISAEGLISRARGRKTEVLFKATVKSSWKSTGNTPSEKVKPFKYKILSTGPEIGAAEACAAFGLEPGSVLWTCKRLRLFSGRPHSLSFHAQPIEQGTKHYLKYLKKLPMWQALNEISVKITGITRTAEASFPSPFVASHLGIRINEPTLVYTYVMLDTNGENANWARIFLRPGEHSAKEYINYETGKWMSDDFGALQR